MAKRERVAAERENEGGSVDGRVVCDALRIAHDCMLCSGDAASSQACLPLVIATSLQLHGLAKATCNCVLQFYLCSNSVNRQLCWLCMLVDCVFNNVFL